MQVINSIVQVFLINNHHTDDQFVKCLLTKFKFHKIGLVESKSIEDDLEYLPKNTPDIILVNLNLDQTSDLNTLKKVKDHNSRKIPILLIIGQKDLIFTSLIAEFDNYLVREEISAPLLEKTILYTLERQANIQELQRIKKENLELTSQLQSNKQLFQSIVDNTSSLVWMTDAQGSCTFANQAWLKFSGQTSGTKLNRNWMINIHPEESEIFQEIFQSSLDKAEGFSIDYRLKCFDHKYRWLSHHAVPNFSSEGQFEGLVCYCFDITKRKEIEHQLVQRAESDRLLSEIARKIHTSLDLDIILQTTVTEVNHILQTDKIQINKVNSEGKLALLFESRLSKQIHSCDISEPEKISSGILQEYIKQFSTDKDNRIIQEPRERHDNGIEETRLLESNGCYVLPVPIISGQDLWGLICAEKYSNDREWKLAATRLLERVAMELSVAIKQAELYHQLEEANQDLQKLSLIDGLTKIANRRKFDQYLAKEWKRLIREQNPLSLILCDIDNFKLYNDTYGHLAGDRCLRKVAQTISKVIKRPADLAARYGGEEFAIILPNTDEVGAEFLAQKIRLQIEALAIPNINSSINHYLTLSLGVASCIPKIDLDFNVLVAAADRGLYQAKKLGRNQVVQNQVVQEKIKLED